MLLDPDFHQTKYVIRYPCLSPEHHRLVASLALLKIRHFPVLTLRLHGDAILCSDSWTMLSCAPENVVSSESMHHFFFFKLIRARPVVLSLFGPMHQFQHISECHSLLSTIV